MPSASAESVAGKRPTGSAKSPLFAMKAPEPPGTRIFPGVDLEAPMPIKRMPRVKKTINMFKRDHNSFPTGWA